VEDHDEIGKGYVPARRADHCVAAEIGRALGKPRRL
jgi:hypothetical protein